MYYTILYYTSLLYPTPQDRGNAHMESIRARQRAVKAQRFIHHYTRYQAHSDSSAMERRIMRLTLTRIADGRWLLLVYYV